jgi:hypothetical protein
MEVMHLYLLQTKEDPGYGAFDAFLIRARTEALARAMASKRLYEDNWLDENITTCTEVTTEGVEEILMESNRGG